VHRSSRLSLWHYWAACGTFLPAVVLGVWQMLMRSPLPAPLDDPDAYYAAVTLHGTVMAYVVTTFFIMGFGYAVAATSLGRPRYRHGRGVERFAVCFIGMVMAAATILAGRASVLYTFYLPLLGSAWYYGGVFLIVAGSMIRVALMILNMAAWKRDGLVLAVPLRNVLPTRAGPQNPQNTVHKPAIIAACPAGITGLARQKIRNPIPLRIRKFVPLGHRRNSRSKNLESYETPCPLAPARWLVSRHARIEG